MAVVVVMIDNADGSGGGSACRVPGSVLHGLQLLSHLITTAVLLHTDPNQFGHSQLAGSLC